MAKILITYGWCRTAYVAVKSLSRAGHDVYACSHVIPSMAGWSRFCKKSARVPNPFDEGETFTKAIADLVNQWGIDLIFPVHEDALILRTYQHLLPDLVILGCPSLEKLELGLDKLEITRLAESCGVPVPETLPCSLETLDVLCEKIGFPFVVKLKHSNSAKGVFFLNTPEDVDELKSSGNLDGLAENAFYAQCFHAGPVVGSCFLAQEGEIVSQFQEKYLRTKNEGKGTSVYRTPYTSNRLSEITQTLVAASGWTGIGHFDFIHDQKMNDYVLLEMNPRPWGAINLAYINGFDFISALVDQSLGVQEDGRHFQKTDTPRNSLWIIGEAIRMVEYLKKKKMRKAFGVPWQIITSLGVSRFDDFVWHDPLPLVAEMACYAKGFLGSGGNTNPD